MRTFFAVPVPEPVRRRMQEVQATLRRTLGGVRWVRPDSVHLTILFLGEIDPGDAGPLVREAERACAGIPAGSARVGGLGCFPPRGGPRVLWVGVHEEAGTLGRLHGALAGAASARGIEVERRPFAPHLTLGRARARLSRPAVERGLAEVGEAELGELPVDRCILYRSILGDGGARYETQGVARLGSACR